MEGGDKGTQSPGALWLLGRAGDQAGRTLSRRVRPRGLTVTSCWALLALYDRKEMPQQSLRRLLGVDRNGMVGLVDTLEERGLVRRSRSTTDRRAHVLALSDHGEEFVAEQLLELVHELDNTISAPLEPADHARLREMLARVIENRLNTT